MRKECTHQGCGVGREPGGRQGERYLSFLSRSSSSSLGSSGLAACFSLSRARRSMRCCITAICASGRGRGEEGQHKTKGRRESSEDASSLKEREDGGKDRTPPGSAGQAQGRGATWETEAPFLRKTPDAAHAHTAALCQAPTPLGEQLAVLSQLQL